MGGGWILLTCSKEWSVPCICPKMTAFTQRGANPNALGYSDMLGFPTRLVLGLVL